MPWWLGKKRDELSLVFLPIFVFTSGNIWQGKRVTSLPLPHTTLWKTTVSLKKTNTKFYFLLHSLKWYFHSLIQNVSLSNISLTIQLLLPYCGGWKENFVPVGLGNIWCLVDFCLILWLDCQHQVKYKCIFSSWIYYEHSRSIS